MRCFGVMPLNGNGGAAAEASGCAGDAAAVKSRDPISLAIIRM